MNPVISSRIGLATAVLALLGLTYNHSILAEGFVAIGIQGLAVALMLWARLTFGRRSFHASAEPTEGGLMNTGPYRYIRHPIYAAATLFTWVAALSHLSAINQTLAIAATIGLLMRIFAEERLMVIRYPEYAEYAAHTKRFIPFVW